MRFSMRSLGGKLTVSAALVLLLCLLLFLLTTWGVLTFYAEREARNNAKLHLSLAKQAYNTNNASLTSALQALASDKGLVSSVTQMGGITQTYLREVGSPIQNRFSLSALDVVAPNHTLIAQLEQDKNNHQLPVNAIMLVDEAAQGHIATSLQPEAFSLTPTQNDAWVLRIALPIYSLQHTTSSILLATQPIDDTLAQTLALHSNANIFLCLAGQVKGMTGTALNYSRYSSSASSICQSQEQSISDGTQHYLTAGSALTPAYQMAASLQLLVVDVEPPITVTLYSPHVLLLLLGIGLCTIAVGVLLLAWSTRAFLTQPLQKLQTQAQTQVFENVGIVLPVQDELRTLSHSFDLLSDSLASESQVMMEQMSNMLVMSDALISTVNLEQLLGEIVARLGHIMQTKHVSLLLYGREMLSPWAVARWSETGTTGTLSPVRRSTRIPESSHLQEKGAVTVHADPDGDVTMAATTKLLALSNVASGKRQAVQVPQPPQTTYGIRRPRIPRPALRDLDMILARMVIAKQKIAYDEDIASGIQEERDGWARMARDAGYGAVIAVPLLLQDQAIGAFMLYFDKPYSVSKRDTFLLSTAAIQASMAIQNALLFAEVKDKNAALERANALKSQFLANVTHELRSPLHSIIGYGSMIVDGFVEGELSPQQEEDIRFIVKRAEDLSHLVDEMLDLSKIEADKIEVRPEPVELATSVQDIINSLKLMADEKNLYLSLDMEEQLPLVLADSHRLRQVITNLVSNALKFTEQGGVMIRCTHLPDVSMVRIAVHDTGIGISPAALGFIFEAFRQADGSTTRRFGGTGLGLAIAKKLVELQGGEIAVESIVGQGSIFSLTLPTATSPNT